MTPPIITVQTLAQFITEAPAPGPARLSVASNSLGQSRIDLQGIGPGGLIWLHDLYSRSCPPAVHEQLPAAGNLVAQWLAVRGYEVRPGRFLTPADLKPHRGRFECFWWQDAGRGWELAAKM